MTTAKFQQIDMSDIGGSEVRYRVQVANPGSMGQTVGSST